MVQLMKLNASMIPSTPSPATDATAILPTTAVPISAVTITSINTVFTSGFFFGTSLCPFRSAEGGEDRGQGWYRDQRPDDRQDDVLHYPYHEIGYPVHLLVFFRGTSLCPCPAGGRTAAVPCTWSGTAAFEGAEPGNAGGFFFQRPAVPGPCDDILHGYTRALPPAWTMNGSPVHPLSCHTRTARSRTA